MTVNAKRLDYPLDPQQKRQHVKALVTLAKRAGLYPQCLHLTGVDMNNIPVAAGTFGDVYKGNLETRAIAVKVVRMFGQSNITKLLKAT